MPLDFTTTVVRNADLGGADRLLEFVAPTEVLSAMTPGQFFMIGIPGADVLLRRPFSVCGLPGTFQDATAGTAQVLYRIYGRATSLMGSLAPGAPLRVLGALGRGFSLPERGGAVPVLVAGGIGSAPFPAWIASLRASGFDRIELLYGARTASELPLLDWFREHCAEVRVATEDGTRGERGRVTDLLTPLLRDADGPRHVYACGPSAMLRAVARISRDEEVHADLALEAPMACGFGVCLGCVVPVTSDRGGPTRYERVCVEGPVMASSRIAW